MANVIATEKLHSQNRELLGRLVLTASVICILGALITLLSLLPAYIDVRTERVARETTLRAFKVGVQKNDEALVVNVDKDILTEARSRIKALEHTGRIRRVGEAIALVIERRPRGAQIHALNYTKNDTVSTLDIIGTIADRAALKEYAGALKGKGPFSEVIIPLTSLARLGGGAFSLSVIGEF